MTSYNRFLGLLCLSVSLVLLGCGGGSSATSGGNGGGSGGGTPATPTPTITSISPTAVKAGSGDTTLTVNGTNFASNSVVSVNSVAEATSYVSSSQLTAVIPAAQIASGAQLSVVVANGSVTSGSGTPVSLEIDNPAPTISSISPAAVLLGATAPVITVAGTGFVSTTAINVNGNARPTTYVSSTAVKATLSTADVSAAASLSITAVNPTPGGGASTASTVTVQNPGPGATVSLSPSSLTVGGSSPVTITVTGTDFIPASVVRVGGQSRATTYVSPTQLTFVATVADQASTQSLYVSVFNPAPGGGQSGGTRLAVLANTPTPVLAQVTPSTILVGSPDTLISVSGSHLTQQLSDSSTVVTSTIYWNNTALSTNLVYAYNGSSTISATVPASQLTAVGTASVSVVSSTSTPPTSNALTVKITEPPPPTITAISPASGPIKTAQILHITGSGFTASSTVALNGATIASTYVDPGDITVNLAASDVSLPGNLELTVTTPAPGGGTTSPTPFTAYVPIVNNSMAFNAVNGLAYVTVPGSAGAPYGNSVVSVDPLSGNLGTPIPVGSEPNRIAVSDDGKFLWVSLDGASAVRRVNLATGAADSQFSVAGNNTGWYANPATVQALAALPGSDTAVVVATNGSGKSPSAFDLAIFDNGVMRSATVDNFSATALAVNGSANEIYAANSNGYAVFTYSASGLVQKGTTANNGTYANYGIDDLQVTGGRAYSDNGTVYDAEAGALLGTFYSASTTRAQGPVVADTALGRAFILDNSQGFSFSGYNQIQVFNINTFNLQSSNTIPVAVNTSSNNNSNGTVSHLTRWGGNGLLFRSNNGIYSLRSNLVQDLSGASTDLSVKFTSSGATATGFNTTYTATVTNSGPSAATEVALTAQLPASGVLVSATSTSGSCSGSGASVACNLGSLANGGAATVTFVVLQTASGTLESAAQVSGSENDPDSTNNQSTTSVVVSGAAYNLQPTLASLSPSGIKAGSSDTVVTITGANFNSGSTAELNGTALATTYTNSGSISATVPAASIAAMGWAPITVVNSAPGGGTSNPLPLTIYKVLTIGVNNIVYDPYSRNIMASVGSGSASVTGNSIAPIQPDSGSVGTAVSIGSQPTNLARSRCSPIRSRSRD